MCIVLPKLALRPANLCPIPKHNTRIMQNIRYIYGSVANYGPESNGLLTREDHRELFRLLRCTRCNLMRYYHQLTAKEMKHNSGSTRTIRFHSLARLIRAYFKGIQEAKKAKSKELFSSINLQINCNDFTLLNFPLTVASKEREKRRESCSKHGREIFDLLFYSPQASQRVVDLSQPLVSNFCEGDEDEDAFVEPSETDSSPQNSCLNLSLNIKCPPGMLLKDSGKLLQVNKEWESKYESAPDRVRTQRVSFFRNKINDTPVSRVHRLRTYEIAAQLLRSDKTWLLESAARSHEEMKARFASNNVQILFPDPSHFNQGQKKAKKRRRRNKKGGETKREQVNCPITCQS